MKYFLIYEIKNLVNGKIYIGQHMTDNPNDGYMGSGIAIEKAIKKYGKENFRKRIVFFATDWQTMNNLEEIMVDDDFVKRDDTYNLVLGGSSGMGRSNKGKPGHPCTEEIKKKIRESNIGQHRSDEAKQHMSESHRGKESPLKGKKRSKEFCQKCSKSMKGRIPWNKGKKMGQQSEETKQKRSEAVKKWWAERKAV